MQLFSTLQLMRPANIVTAIADILAGMVIAGVLIPVTWNSDALFLIISTFGLYSGGIVFNDVFDIEQDKINRPERVIPSGRVSLRQAKILGIFLLSLGVLAAFQVSNYSGAIAITIAVFALIYDKWAKHNAVFGPLFMGLCRAFNLILGMSIVPELDKNYLLIGFIPLIFIAAITLTAQNESKGNNKKSIGIAMFLDGLIVIGFLLMWQYLNYDIQNGVLFLALWYGVNFWAKRKALKVNEPKNIMKAVKFGVLSLIPLNACYVAGFSTVLMGVAVLALLPISLYLSKKFPVT